MRIQTVTTATVLEIAKQELQKSSCGSKMLRTYTQHLNWSACPVFIPTDMANAPTTITAKPRLWMPLGPQATGKNEVGFAAVRGGWKPTSKIFWAAGVRPPATDLYIYIYILLLSTISDIGTAFEPRAPSRDVALCEARGPRQWGSHGLWLSRQRELIAKMVVAVQQEFRYLTLGVQQSAIIQLLCLCLCVCACALVRALLKM